MRLSAGLASFYQEKITSLLDARIYIQIRDALMEVTGNVPFGERNDWWIGIQICNALTERTGHLQKHVVVFLFVGKESICIGFADSYLDSECADWD